MLVTNRELLDAAKEGAYAVGAFNINNLEFVQGITEAAAEQESPVIIAVSEGAIKYAGFDNIVSLVKNTVGSRGVKASLHLDHGKDMAVIDRCIAGGFTSVMIDGSHLPLEGNIEVTGEVVKKAGHAGVSVEGELGRLAGIEDNVSVEERDAILTNPDDAVQFVEQTGVDSLAIAIGTSHGAYKFKGESKLALDRLTEIAERVSIPLVLHGASGVNPEHVALANKFGADIKGARGVSDADVIEAVRRGICKVNIDTDMRIGFMAHLRRHLAENGGNIDPRKYLGAGREAIKEVVTGKIMMLGSKGKSH